MRTTIHSKIKESPLERHYGRKPRTELTNYLNLPTDDNEFISAQPATLQVYSFNNGRGGYDQLIMKTPRKLKCDNRLSRRGENRIGIDERFIQMSLPSLETEDMDEEGTQSEEEEGDKVLQFRPDPNNTDRTRKAKTR